ncbi:MAG: amylo-alpha-1,6-glucosidase [Anaerolineae bacterium]
MSQAGQAYQRATDLLRTCLTEAGFLASVTEIDNYPRVWARDGAITGLAALLADDENLIDGFRRTLDTLAQHQGPHGEIPSNVTVGGEHVSYGGLVGRVDAPLWYVLGVCQYVLRTGDDDFLNRHRSTMERALFLVGCWEFNARGLIYAPMSSDWADEYIQHGYALVDQMLYLWALDSFGRAVGDDPSRRRAATLREQIEVNYWPHPSLSDDPRVYHPAAYRRFLADHPDGPSHWLATFTPGGYATRFDGLANALALLASPSTPRQALRQAQEGPRGDAGSGDVLSLSKGHRLGKTVQMQTVIETIEMLNAKFAGPDDPPKTVGLVPSFYPVIRPGGPEWPALRTNYAFRFQNQPYEYHNGGLWPVITGFYAAALARHGEQVRAEAALQAINAANAQGLGGETWGFYEYLNGQTHRPAGTRHLAWSAAATVIAHRVVVDKQPFLI